MIGRRSYTAGVTAHSVFAERKAEEKPQTKWDQENERKAKICLSCTEPDCKGTCARMRRKAEIKELSDEADGVLIELMIRNAYRDAEKQNRRKDND